MLSDLKRKGGCRVVQRYCENFQCRGVLLIWIIHVVGRGPVALAVDACRGLFGHFFLTRLPFSFLSPSVEAGLI